MFIGLPVVGSPEFILKRCNLCQFYWKEMQTHFFSESLVEGERREFLRDPRLGMAFVAGVHTIDFATILKVYKVNPKEFETR